MKTRAPFALVLAAVLAGCGGGDDGPLYQVTYSATEQAASGSFSRDIVARDGDELFVSGQSVQLTFVTASITANGTLLKAGAARGQAIATAVCCQRP